MENEPKIEYRFGLDGSHRWYLDGLYHNDEGPSIIYAYGTKCWHKNGYRHRLDGPAIEYIDGRKEWYFNDSYVTDLIEKWAKENDIDLYNLSEDDKILIKLVWSDYGK